ncbi:hypothetical protein RISK_002255 [Rhodopirellula islandica]|uniref:Uncharacterized protein n=1 Tax=Rhodopirellula islandica TaxID=595434 RepID=A0A0J1BGG5_RHOIS|nr:hypothetical protein RISK_002255 [Rhodopirellula islandica]
MGQQLKPGGCCEDVRIFDENETLDEFRYALKGTDGTTQ